MEKTNVVVLDGAIEGCRIVRNGDSGTVAGMSLFTFSPKPGAPKNAKMLDRYNRIRHLVEVCSSVMNDPKLSELERSCREEKKIRPYRVKGRLEEYSGENVVVARVEDLVPTTKINLKKNNEVSISGPVKAVSYSDALAVVHIDTGPCEVRSLISREQDPEAWKAVAEGQIRKGDVVLISGTLNSMRYGDGEKALQKSLVSMRKLKQIQQNLTKEKEEKKMPSFRPRR